MTAGNATAEAFGPLLRRFRSRAGLTQEELAERAGISARAVSDLERGLRSRPYPETVRLLAAALALADNDRAALLQAARPEVSASESPQGQNRQRLPVPPTPLVGREREVGEILGRLTRPAVRLLTLTGPGGTGKTRLALAVVEQLSDTIADGLVFVPLAPLTDPALVPSAIAEALGVREEGGQPLRERLQQYLATKQVLLVLDNVEHLVSGVAPLVSDLLAAAPELRVLATSRVPLRLRGEHEYPVPPLGLPRRKPPPTAEQLSQYEAVRLFIDRAQAVRADFAISNETAPAVAEICHRLDGLPLAIELAAARSRMLSPQAMLTRLEQRLPLLTGGARDAPARQQTLRNAIAWSYDLLEKEDQTLFQRLAVFAGGMTLEAVEAVVNSDGNLDVFAGLERLVEQSLLRQEEGSDGEPRFTMLETIREFGQEQLEASGEVEEMRRRHAAFFLTRAEAAEPGLYGADDRIWLQRLDAEHDNLRTALGWSMEREPETALRLVAAVWRLWYVRGHLLEGQAWADRVLETSEGTATITRGRVLNGAATLVAALGDANRDHALNEASLALAQELGDQIGQVRALHDLGVGSFEQGTLESGRIFLEAAVSLARELGEWWWVAAGLTNLAEIAVHQGDLSGAMPLLEEALRLSRQNGLRSVMASVTTALGVVAEARGDLPSAITWHRQGLALFSEVGNPGETIRTLHYLACAVLAQESTEQATRLLSAVQSLHAAIGIRMGPLDQARYDDAVRTARANLSEALFTAAWDSGRGLSLEEATAQALALADELARAEAAARQSASDVLLAPGCP
jgi:predicted ATPase/transcriptional regulator with XRE-family HTH domain